MGHLFARHRDIWKQKSFSTSVALGSGLFGLSLLINYAAGTYATEVAGRGVADLILDHVPVFNVSLFFIQGFGLFILSIAVVLFARPKAIPFALKTIALFITLRALAVTLTHIGVPVPHSPYPNDSDVVGTLTFGGDLFFSGHAGLPYLISLMFWPEKNIRWFFLTVSVLFASVVLLGHLHYSIDVFAAYFITYGIYHLAKELFPHDRRLLLG